MSKSNKQPANPQYREQKREAALSQRKVSRKPVDPYCDEFFGSFAEARALREAEPDDNYGPIHRPFSS